MIETGAYTRWLFLFLAGPGLAFTQSPATVRLLADRQEILIGQPLRLTMEVRFPPGGSTAWFSIDSIAHFDIIEKGKIDSLVSDSGLTLQQTWVMTSFDSGRWVIPPLSLTLEEKKYLTDSLDITVNFSPFDPKQDYHDIKDILDVENPYTWYILWAILGITALSLAGCIYFLTRKTRAAFPVSSGPIPGLSPYEEAIQALDEVRKQRLPESGEPKLYYTLLNDIFRMYVFRQFGMASLQKTNEELILQLKERNLPNDQFASLTQALRISDFVKFAKYQPSAQENTDHFQVIRASVEFLHSIPQ